MKDLYSSTLLGATLSMMALTFSRSTIITLHICSDKDKKVEDADVLSR